MTPPPSSDNDQEREALARIIAANRNWRHDWEVLPAATREAHLDLADAIMHDAATRTITGWAIAVELTDGSDAGTFYWHNQCQSLDTTLYRTRAEAKRHIMDLAHTRWRNQRPVRVTITISAPRKPARPPEQAPVAHLTKPSLHRPSDNAPFRPV